MKRSFKLVYFVPEEFLDQTKKACFHAGAGQQGHYSECCFETQGVGQFKPSLDAHPHIGEHNKIQKVHEYKVEMLVPTESIHAVVNELIKSHPYEEVAYEIYEIMKI